MNLAINISLITIKLLCTTISTTGYQKWLPDDYKNFVELLDTELQFYLLSLSSQDGIVSRREVKFIEEYFDISYSIDDIVDVLDEYRDSINNFTENIPYIFDVFVKIEKDLRAIGDYRSITEELIKLYYLLGTDFIACDGAKTIRRHHKVNKFIYILNQHKINNGLEGSEVAEIAMKEFISKFTGIVNSDNRILSSDIKAEEIDQKDLDIEEIDLIDEDLSIEDLLLELNGLVGMEGIKKDVNSLINIIKIRKIREDRGITQVPMSFHLVFSGNPGTGKTTVARLLAEIYHSLGLLSKGQLVEVDRSGLVGGYVGQTAIKVQDVIQKSLGGVLFIDEAYSLTKNASSNDYGMEAVETLLKAMEDNRDDLIVIVAGYTDLMEEFLNSNPGLRSRFNKYFLFEDYNAEELQLILERMCEKNHMKLSHEAKDFSYRYFQKRCSLALKNFANARDVRNFFEQAITNQANRLSLLTDINDEMLSTFEIDDFNDIVLH